MSVSARTRVNWPRPSNSAMHYIYPAHLYPPRRPAHRRTAFQLTSAAVCLKVAVCKPLMMTRGSAFAGVLRPTLRRWNLVRAWQSTCLGLARLAAQRSRLTHEPQKFRCDVVICGYSKVMEKGDPPSPALLWPPRRPVLSLHRATAPLPWGALRPPLLTVLLPPLMPAALPREARESPRRPARPQDAAGQFNHPEKGDSGRVRGSVGEKPSVY